MVVRPKINLQNLRNKILCFLHYRCAHSENISFISRELLDYLPVKSVSLIDAALQELDNEEMTESEIVEVREEYLESHYITPKGIQFVDDWSNELYTKISDEIIFEDTDLDDSESSTFPTFEEFRDALLVKLVEREESEGPILFDPKETADLAKLQYRDGWVRKAANWFDNQEYTTTSAAMGGGPDGNLDVGILADGLEYADEIRSRGRSPSVQPSKLPIQVSGAPASDRYVELDHNAQPYKDAVAALDSAISSVAGDNGYGDRDPEDKAYRLQILGFGRKLLDGARIAVNDVKSLLIGTLEYLAKISVAVAKIAAAIAAIKLLIGL